MRLSGLRPERVKVVRKFSSVVKTVSRDCDVAVSGGRGFGSGALKVNGKIFAMMSSKNQFVAKLPKDRVDTLIAAGAGERFEPRAGRPMKEWIVLVDKGVNWVEIAEEAREFVKRSKP